MAGPKPISPPKPEPTAGRISRYETGKITPLVEAVLAEPVVGHEPVGVVLAGLPQMISTRVS